MFFGLPFLQHTEVEDGFIQLMALCPNELYGHRFADYILKKQGKGSMETTSYSIKNVWQQF